MTNFQMEKLKYCEYNMIFFLIFKQETEVRTKCAKTKEAACPFSPKSITLFPSENLVKKKRCRYFPPEVCVE